jgi:TP901 family phage tail tape measure protein
VPAIAEAAIQIVPDFDRFGRELDTGLKRSLRSVGGGISSIMRMATQATAALGGAMTIVGAQSLKASADLERSMQMIEGLVGIFDPVQLNSFKDAIAEIAPATGQSATELGKAMFFITSAGARGANAIEILNSTARLGAAGLGDLSEIAKGVVSAVNAYGQENLNATEAADMFANTVRLGNLEAQSLAPVLGHVIPIASQMGVSFDQVGGAIAGMTRLGQSAAESATALRATMSQLLKPTGRAGEALESVGLSSEMLRDSLATGKLDLLGVLTLVQKAFDGNTSAMAEAFPNLRALRGVLALVGSNYEDNRMIMDEMRDSTGVATEAFDAQSETLQFKLNQMMSAYKTLTIQVGDALKPFVIPIIEDFTKKLQAQGNSLPELITRLGLYLQLFTGRLDFSAFVQSYTEAFGSFSTENNKLVKAYMVTKGQFEIISPVIRQSFAALTTAFIENFGDLFPAFEGFNFTVTDVTNAIIFTIQKLTDFLINTGFPMVRKFIALGKEQFESFRPTLQRYMDFFKYVFDEVKRVVNLFVENFRVIWEKYGEEITRISTWIGENVIRVFKGLFDIVMGLVKMFIALFSGDFDTFKEGFIQAVKGLYNVVVGIFQRFVQVIILAFQILFITVKNLIKFAFEGILNIVVFSLDWLVTKVQDFGNLVALKFTELKDNAIRIFNILKQFFPVWWQNIKDFFARGFNWLIEKLGIFGRFFVDQGFQAQVLAPVINKVTEWWNKLKDFFKTGYDWIIEKTSMFGTWIVSNGFGKWIASVVDKVKVFWDNLKSKFQEFLGGDGFLATFVRSGLNGLKFIFENTIGRIINIVKGLFNGLKTFIFDWINSGFLTAISNLFNTIKDRIASGINSMIGVLNKIIDKYNSIAAVPDIPHVPTVNFGGMKDGGIVGNGGLAVIGEAGPELVNIPSGASVTPLPANLGMGHDEARMFAAAMAKQVNVVIELDSDIIAQKTAPIMVDTIRLKQGITIV